MRRSRWTNALAALLAALALAACDDEGAGGPADAAGDATDDAGDGSGPDADAGDDAQPDGGADADASEVPDAHDTDGDGGADLDEDTADANPDAAGDADAGSDGGEPGEPWSWCPGSDVYVGNMEWERALVVESDEAIYCNEYNEGLRWTDDGEVDPLPREAERKVQLRFVPGTYPLPDAAGTFDLVLPLCLRVADPEGHPLLAGTGSFGPSVLGPTYSQPLETGAGDAWELRLTFAGNLPASGTVATLDGGHIERMDFEGVQLTMMLCPGSCDDGLVGEWRTFDSCAFEAFDTRRNHVEFEGGEVDLDFRMGVSPASTEPGVFYRAAGTLDGTAFEQLDFWHLVYNPLHHHFERDYAVLFDEPIGGACGLSARDVDDDAGTGQVTRIDRIGCDFQSIESLAVTDESFAVIPVE